MPATSIILIIALISALMGCTPGPPQAIGQLAPLSENGKQILEQALDKALQDWIANLFSVWMIDPTGQPDRAIEGSRRAIAAYHFARNRIGLQTAPSAHIKRVLYEGLDQALRAYLVRLFSAWMHETGGKPSPRNLRLMEVAMKSYLDARRALEQQYDGEP
jgi:hypothetical protein